MKRHGWLSYLALSGTLLVGCDRTISTSEAAQVDAAVYAAVLNRMLHAALQSDSAIVLLDSTVTIRPRVPAAAKWDNANPIAGDERVTVRRFEAVSQQRRSLRPLEPVLRRQLQRRLVFASEQDYSRIEAALDTMRQVTGRSDSTTEWYWRAFYERFPGSIGAVSLSAIGYNRTGDLAVLYVDKSCGPLCGHGSIVLVKRDSNGWHVVTTLQQWFS